MKFSRKLLIAAGLVAGIAATLAATLAADLPEQEVTVEILP